jgi:hypothetical protein
VHLRTERLSFALRDPKVETAGSAAAVLTGEITMKTWPFTVILLGVGMLIPLFSFAQESEFSEFAPEYEISQESRFKGIVDEMQRRICPISGGMDTHLMVEIGNKIYEVHVAPLKFLKMYKADFQKGDAVEIVGVKTTFQHRDAILAREIKDGKHHFVFRDEQGNPIW